MKLNLSVSPHIRSIRSSRKIMFSVIAALMFPAFAGVYYFGSAAFWIIAVCIISSQLTETIILKLRDKDTKITGGAIITGMILGLMLPPTVPLWLCAVGSAFGITIGKQVFGGSGSNIFNPALVGRVFMSAGWPELMNTFVDASSGFGIGTQNIADAVTSATPLISKAGMNHSVLFLGSHGGCIGETSILFILLGGIILLIKGYIDFRIPIGMVGTVFALSLVCGTDPIYQIFAGGLMFGAFFIATDYVTSPMSKKGRMIYAVCIGILVFLMRSFGTMPEGVAYSILFMNAVVPMIDRYCNWKIFGEK